MKVDNLTVTTDNAKGFQSSQKRLKLKEYFKSQIGSNSLVFLQETHSTPKNEKEWQDGFKDKMFH